MNSQTRNHPLYFNKELIMDLTRFLLVAGILVWLLYEGNLKTGYNWQWYRIPSFFGRFTGGNFIPGPLILGTMVTIKVSLAGMLLSSILGLATALARFSPFISLRCLALGYMELIRNTPLLVQIFFIYFVISPVLGISRFLSAVLALGLFEGAYASEIIRAGMVSVDKGQWEAAASIGLSRYRIFRHIILPQALAKMIPPLAGQTISLIKDSALVSTIALYDLTMEAQSIIAETYMVFELWITVAVLYLGLTLSLSLITRHMEARASLDNS